MTEQTNAAGKGYNISITPLGDIDTTPNAKGTAKIKFRGKFTTRGKDRERTVVAQGKAADAIRDVLVAGTPVALRVLFENAPSEEEGKKGGEYLSVLGLPLSKAA